ncbi:aminotransferase-like domain-containing protein [Pseudoalteromonas luteoviolacea]|uniref:Aminotransferase class I/classII large domain-containing protein n=1 Tax=Pseudoalteromonas luteoviolacea H33 TaxID=1365251 RepID=A0A167DRQ8_9GAMM|nr:PLP-dependent aminotransferase family protein [Pseudoalteromonas luteoviolacea]KZN49261.1 hypothetical protein N476_19630 [Pseudoalteromonas luteoviolacea H33]KZN74936.1 hypothetical protein N477_21160 [Pseudoalteromonas luteoviolacea H33-S]MBQ4878383.1 PLP-dependent aminotransferase family protein [Pseudoalteromonas luteoviolacea]MBQ4907538.1 PLP-dependent aminotransferase family protein [Pseudoalteromonas luteoviolacea]
MSQAQVMNFLNEVAMQFPDAISFASGRPHAKFLNHSNWERHQAVFTEYFAEQRGINTTKAANQICHYGPSTGIINGILQKYLATDENIHVDTANIVITNGCQEALLLACLNELKEPSDCALTIDPSYVGFSGMVNTLGKRVEPVELHRLTDIEQKTYQFNWDYLREKVEQLKHQNINAKIIYINPDFNNPLAYQLSINERQELLKICQELNLRIIEDDPYSRFKFTDSEQPSLKALDKFGLVYHIGSFSKTFCPGVRVGYIVAPNGAIAHALGTIKSLTSVNTSSISQSVIGGWLIEQQYSLNNWMEPINQQYLSQCHAMNNALTENFQHKEGVQWNNPNGGFFYVIKVPFNFTKEHITACANENKVICMPVSFFSLSPQIWARYVRLSFSYYEPEKIHEGVKSFSQYIVRNS